MAGVEKLITEHIDVWTSAIKKRNATGRGSNKKNELTGIQKLRELILELAVRGKLVPQDASDEPASVLLEKIAAEKAQLIADKKIKKQKSLPVIKDEEKSFELPTGWEWSQLACITNFVNGYAFKSKDFEDTGVGIIKIGDIQDGQVATVTMSRVPQEVVDLIGDDFQVQKGDLLIAMSGATTGKLGFNTSDEIFYLNQRVGKIQSFGVLLEYLYFPLTTKIAENLSKAIGSAIPNISTTQINEIVIALPPLAEQHRIVAKVDELMVLCDQLEQQTEQSLTAHQTLVEVLLASLTNGTSADDDNKEDFQTSWQRIAEHFDVLFTTEASIEQLKQTILQLAVMGKLVPQNPNDEPASVLLDKIAEEKTQLIADKKIKKQKPLPTITDEERPFELPNSWQWCNLEDTALTSEAGWSPRCLPTARENNEWGVLKVSAVTWGTFNPNENKELPSGLEPRPQYEVHTGDFLISRANTAELVARAVIVPAGAPRKLMMSDKIIRFVLSNRVKGSFISLVNNSRFSRAYYAEVAGGTSSSMKNVSREQIRRLIVALPPLAEQHRIVAKVDELMALCEQLKARLSDAQTTQLHLADAVVENALGDAL
jgi:type I restriction enzyme, S subunit